MWIITMIMISIKLIILFTIIAMILLILNKDHTEHEQKQEDQSDNDQPVQKPVQKEYIIDGKSSNGSKL